jgi:outer membrane protein OmpA-like peptidoglycan-associated protein
MSSIHPLRLALVALALLAFNSVTAQNVEESIDGAADRLEAARSEQLYLIAPSHFGKAQEKLEEARERYDRGGKIDDIERLVGQAEREITEAERYREIGYVLMRDALKARSDAAEANAPEFASREWDEAEKQIQEAGKKVERGDQNGARERASRAESGFRTAELTAIRADVLGRSRAARDRAEKAEAPKWSSVTFVDAVSLLDRAETELQANRYDRSEARALAQAATSQFDRSARIAAEAVEVDDDIRRLVEALVLRHEEEMRKVAEEFRLSPDFAGGIEAVTAEVLSAVASLYDDRANLEAELQQRDRAIVRLQDVEMRRLSLLADSLDSRLAELEQREKAVTAELRQKEEREQKINRIRAAFDPDEAEVIMAGEELVVRLYGLTFPVGSAEIRPSNFSLLTKVQRVLREFPDAPIVVGGHTDAQGNDATNQSLSQRRADAVREYLLANMSIPNFRLEAVGFGESQPIASNETADGRAKNRRIDVGLKVN